MTPPSTWSCAPRSAAHWTCPYARTTKDLSAQIGSSRLSFAPEESLWELLRCHPGSASILGLANDTEHWVQLLIDREVCDAPFFSCHPCICTSTLKLKTADVLEKLLPHTGHTPVIVDL